MMPAGICIPNVIDARHVPMMAARRSNTIDGTVEIFPQIPRILDPSLHSLNKAATSSVDCTLLLVLSMGLPSEYIRISDDCCDKRNDQHLGNRIMSNPRMFPPISCLHIHFQKSRAIKSLWSTT
jgi:hypothetical protein